MDRLKMKVGGCVVDHPRECQSMPLIMNPLHKASTTHSNVEGKNLLDIKL